MSRYDSPKPTAASTREADLIERLVLLQQMAWSLYIGIQDALRVPSMAQNDELGRMTAEELRAIGYCQRCLEPYERCVCDERKVRRGS